MNRSLVCLSMVCVLAAFTLARADNEPPVKMSPEEKKLLDLTNAERKKKELPLLRPSPALFALARAHSANMAKQGKMEHTLDGKSPFDRMRDANYLFLRGGENIAACDAKFPQTELMQYWMDSKPHRENILGPDFTDIGLGLASAKDGKVYYTQVFSKPREKEE
jgi:uncharacterized protein YkwD